MIDFKKILEKQQKLLKKLKKHYLEIVFLTIAGFLTSVNFLVYRKVNENIQNKIIDIEQKSLNKLQQIPQTRKIYIDISGAVEIPNVYAVSESARLIDVLILAGGLSAKADRGFFLSQF